MKNIGLIDDNSSFRLANKRAFEIILTNEHKGWKIIDSEPFKEFDDCRSWILEEDISVLILDERLNDRSLSDGSHVDYYGSDLVKYLRNYFKDFPIFCVTAVALTEELKASLPFFNMIISSDELDSYESNYINLFVKSGTSFYKENEKELARLNELSKQMVDGKINKTEEREIKAIQAKLLLPHFFDNLSSKDEHLEKMEDELSQMVSMQEDLKKILKNSK